MSAAKKEEIVPVGSKFVTSAVGLVATSKPTWGEWECALSTVAGVHRSCQWWLGDLLNYGHSVFGEEIEQAIPDLGYDPHYLDNLKSVASKIPLSRRRESLSFSHHQTVAALDEKAQEFWLSKAQKEHMTVAQLRAAVNEREEDVDVAETPDESDIVEQVVSIVLHVEEEYRHSIIQEIIQRLREMDRGKA